MSGGVNKVFLLGYLGRDPEVKYTQSGKAVASMSLATSEKWTVNGQTKDKTEWHKLVVWGKLAEVCGEYLRKGSQIWIEGRLATRSWDDKEGGKHQVTEIVVNQMQMLGGGKASANDKSDQSSKVNNGNDSSSIPDDEIPF